MTHINTLFLAVALSCAAVISYAAVSSSTSPEAARVLRSSPGGFLGVYAVNFTTTQGFLVVINATSIPSDGAIVPIDCMSLPASGNAAINYQASPIVFTIGVVAILTSASDCFTKTTGTITGYIHGNTQ
jgi:hypothetical protein